MLFGTLTFRMLDVDVESFSSVFFTVRLTVIRLMPKSSAMVCML